VDENPIFDSQPSHSEPEVGQHLAFGKVFKPVGFYKRGCQVKTLLLSREERIFFGHPAQLAALRTLFGARLASPNASDICGIMFFAFFRAASLRH